MEHGNNPKYGVAIDIGASKVSVLVGEQSESGRIKIIAGCSVPIKSGIIKRGEIENVNKVSEAIKQAVTTIEKEDNIKINRATLGITGQHILCESKTESTYVKFSDEISQDDIDELIGYIKRAEPKPGYSMIDILPIEYSIDNKHVTDNPLGSAGNKLTGHFNVVYGDNQKLNFARRAVTKAGIEVVDMVPFSFAAATSVLTEEDKELGVCIIDLGATTTEVSIFKDKKLRFTATLPYGVSLIDNDIKCWGILERYVESLKVQYGSAMPEYTPDDVAIEISTINSSRPKLIPQRTIARIIEARITEIIKGIREILNQSGYYSRLSEGIVLTGGGAKLTHIDRLFKKVLNCETRVGIPDLRIDNPENDIIRDPRYATTIGILLKGMDRGEDMDVEIIPQTEELELEKTREKEEKVKEKEKEETIQKKSVEATPLDFKEEEEEEEDENEEEEEEEDNIEEEEEEEEEEKPVKTTTQRKSLWDLLKEKVDRKMNEIEKKMQDDE